MKGSTVVRRQAEREFSNGDEGLIRRKRGEWNRSREMARGEDRFWRQSDGIATLPGICVSGSLEGHRICQRPGRWKTSVLRTAAALVCASVTGCSRILIRAFAGTADGAQPGLRLRSESAPGFTGPEPRAAQRTSTVRHPAASRGLGTVLPKSTSARCGPLHLPSV